MSYGKDNLLRVKASDFKNWLLLTLIFILYHQFFDLISLLDFKRYLLYLRSLYANFYILILRLKTGYL